MSEVTVQKCDGCGALRVRTNESDKRWLSLDAAVPVRAGEGGIRPRVSVGLRRGGNQTVGTDYCSIECLDKALGGGSVPKSPEVVP